MSSQVRAGPGIEIATWQFSSGVMQQLFVQEKDLLRGMKEDCRVDHPRILPRIIDCIDYRDHAQVR
jgi:hypothetical protein